MWIAGEFQMAAVAIEMPVNGVSSLFQYIIILFMSPCHLINTHHSSLDATASGTNIRERWIAGELQMAVRMG